jgi:hypothetical protein
MFVSSAIERTILIGGLEEKGMQRRRLGGLAAAGVRAGRGKRAALPGEPSRAPRDLTRTIMDGCDGYNIRRLQGLSPSQDSSSERDRIPVPFKAVIGWSAL